MNSPKDPTLPIASIEDVTIPDRYESLVAVDPQSLRTIIIPVEEALEDIDQLYTVIKMAKRGAFMILRGDSGSGKSTFLHTLDLYRDNVATVSLPGGSSVPQYLCEFTPRLGIDLHIIVLEEREAAISFSDDELESWLHAINGFIRSKTGQRVLIVWPCNSDALKTRLVDLALRIGGNSLLGSKRDATYFNGPNKERYIDIVIRTLGALNQGANISDFGLTTDELQTKMKQSDTVGDFLGLIRDLIIEKQIGIARLLPKEQPKVWVVVIAGNDPAGEVAGLTRGNLALVDMDRLMSSTEANIVRDLKKIPEKLGVLATVLNAKILHLPVMAATAAIRQYADDKLREKLKSEGFALMKNKPQEAKDRILQSEFGSVMGLGTQKTLTRGKKLGSKSVESFTKVAKIASNDDASVNRAIGRALVNCGLIESFDVESSFSGKYTVRSDIVAKGKFGTARVEMMWREKTGRADIANYTLKKLEVYGKAIGLIE